MAQGNDLSRRVFCRSAALQFRDGSYIVGQLRNIGESWDRHLGYVVRREEGLGKRSLKLEVRYV